MAVKKLKPVTPGQRFRLAPTFEVISYKAPEKSLVRGKTKSGGRNQDGRMTMRHIGGGHKQKYRVIDFLRDKHKVSGVIKHIEYDPNRTAYVALVYYKDGEKRYMLAPQGMKVGDEVIAGAGVPPEVGNALPMKELPLGTIIHNIELSPGKGGQLVRSAGSYAQIVAREGKYATIKLPSGEMRLVLANCFATVGSVSNTDHMNEVLGKAGRRRWKGRRPRTRGVAMNPVDHPMGGGEGRASGGHPRNRNGLYTKGLKTRKPKKYSDKYIVKRKKK